VRGELKGFTDWLAANGAKGYIGEVGWPNNALGDAGQWNALAEAWYQDADRAGLWVTAWGTHQRIGQSNLGIYKTAVDYVPPLAVRDTQADVFERHPTTPAYLRGINVWGAIIHAPYRDEPFSSFSNLNPGTYGYYGYDDQSTFDFLRARGVRVIRLGFRWERLQRLPGAPLDAAELQRLKDGVSRIRAAGLQAIIYPHNFGAYYLDDGTRGVRRTIGSAEVTQAHFVDLWARLSTEFRDDGTVVGYNLMNEPTGMGGAAWRAQSQGALDAIRANGDAKLILVPGYDYSGVHAWASLNPVAWIRDPRDNFRYEAHHYFDRDHSGTYASPYTDEVTEARARGF
jgi:aryl-phospho-beta-D-glucosidase BglC (GH1 family)